MLECSRIIEFDAAHRVIGHEHKCKYLHGHRYKLELTVTKGDELDSLGRVVDFGELKSIIKNWVDENLDHNVILSKDDVELGDFINFCTKQKVYYLKANPTAENIATHLKNDIFPNLLDKLGCNIVKLRIYETPNCFVDVI